MFTYFFKEIWKTNFLVGTLKTLVSFFYLFKDLEIQSLDILLELFQKRSNNVQTPLHVTCIIGFSAMHCSLMACIR